MSCRAAKKERNHCSRVEQEAGDVIADRVHPPEHVVGAEGEPGDRMVVAHLEGGEHPGELAPAKPPPAQMVEVVLVVIPAEEVAKDAGKERKEGQDRDEGRRPPPIVREHLRTSERSEHSLQGWEVSTASHPRGLTERLSRR